MITSKGSSPDLSTTSNYSPKSLNRLAHGPATSAAINLMPFFRQKSSNII